METTTHEPTASRGFALPVAIFALVIIGVLVTGGFFVARQESRIGVASQNATEAFYIAERGLAQVVGDWTAPPFIDMPVFNDTTIAGTVDGGTWSVRVIKTGDQTFFMNSTGTVTEGGLLSGAMRQIGMLTKVVIPNIRPPAALTTRGVTTIDGTAGVMGMDSIPYADTSLCSPPDTMDNKPGVLTGPNDTIRTNGTPDLNGNPDTLKSSSVDTTTFTVFGEMTYDDLVAMASWHYDAQSITSPQPSYDTDGRCLTSDRWNWGEPFAEADPCTNHFPILHFRSGTTTIQSGGYGQGILLVDGDLSIRGSFTFYGIIIVQGTFDARGTGSGIKIIGGVLAKNAELDRQQVAGGSVISNSTCVANRAVRFSSRLSRPRPLAERSWVDVSALNP